MQRNGWMVCLLLAVGCNSPPADAEDVREVCSGKAPMPPAGWMSYQAKDGAFRVSLPHRPGASPYDQETSSEMFEVGDALMYRAAHETMPWEVLLGPELVMDVYEAIKPKRLRPEKETRLTCGGHPGRETVARVRAGRLVERARIFQIGTHGYRLAVTTIRGQEHSASASAFLDSFRALVAP